MNIEKIKVQVKNAIKKKPTHIKIYRKNVSTDGMSPSTGIPVGEADVFFDDSKRAYITNSYSDSGVYGKVRSLSILAVPGFEIIENDYFNINKVKYKVIYPAQIVEGVYECDLEVLK